MNRGVWISWNENIRHGYEALWVPRSEQELVECIKQAPGKIRMFGHRYSSADICAGVDTLIDLTRYDEIVSFDEERMQITAQAGAKLSAVIEAVEAKGWAIGCLPDIAGVTLGGAIATGTHGTGREGRILADYMVACRLVLASGEVREISEDDALMPAARVSLGVLGVLSEITLQCEPLYTLHLKERPMRDAQWLSQLDALQARHDFLRILWLPHTDHGYVITGDRVPEGAPVETDLGPGWLKHRRAVSRWLYAYTYRFPALTAPANRILQRLFFSASKEHKGTLYGATVTKKRGSTMELSEWTIARSRFPKVFAEIKAALESPDNAAYAHVPMDVRFIKQDDSWLSYAYGEDCVTVGCVCRDSPNADRYEAFNVMEEIFLKHGGRPHWAKRFKARAEQLRELYPKWDAFQEARQALDPEGRFLNPYLDELLNA